MIEAASATNSSGKTITSHVYGLNQGKCKKKSLLETPTVSVLHSSAVEMDTAVSLPRCDKNKWQLRVGNIFFRDDEPTISLKYKAVSNIGISQVQLWYEIKGYDST